MVAIRDAGLPMPGCGWCISPWVDMEAVGETMSSKAEADPTVQKAGILDMARLYLNGADPRSPLAAPLYADLTRPRAAADPGRRRRDAARRRDPAGAGRRRGRRLCRSADMAGNDPCLAPVPSGTDRREEGDRFRRRLCARAYGRIVSGARASRPPCPHPPPPQAEEGCNNAGEMPAVRSERKADERFA